MIDVWTAILPGFHRLGPSRRTHMYTHTCDTQHTHTRAHVASRSLTSSAPRPSICGLVLDPTARSCVPTMRYSYTRDAVTAFPQRLPTAWRYRHFHVNCSSRDDGRCPRERGYVGVRYSRSGCAHDPISPCILHQRRHPSLYSIKTSTGMESIQPATPNNRPAREQIKQSSCNPGCCCRCRRRRRCAAPIRAPGMAHRERPVSLRRLFPKKRDKTPFPT